MRAPPLGLLQTFEVAARHESFSRAAAELHLTPAAVSQQIRNLERLLGITLFVRCARSLALTESGRDYADRIRIALNDVQLATRAVRQPVGDGTLRVSTFCAFGMLWLLPRLPQFRAAHPGIELRLSFSRDLVDPSRDSADVAIRFGSGRYPHSEVIELARDVVGRSAALSYSPAEQSRRERTNCESFRCYTTPAHSRRNAHSDGSTGCRAPRAARLICCYRTA